MMNMHIVDYGAGNIGSVVNMVKRVGGKAIVTSDANTLLEAEKIVLPGVGSFDSGMAKLQASGLIEVLNQKVLDEKVPFLGVCLGAQMCTQGSEEGSLPGLGWFDAETVRFDFPSGSKLKLPHMGWNYVTPQVEHPILKDLPTDSRFYFVHKYYMNARAKDQVFMTTNYGLEFHSALIKDNIIAVQFHPEKSHKYGMQLLSNFMKL